MGCAIEIGYDGRELQVHAFDSHSEAVKYLTASRAYTFVRHVDQPETPGIAFFIGERPAERANLTQSGHGYWLVKFWRVDDPKAFA